jgi:hypothetical protein
MAKLRKPGSTGGDVRQGLRQHRAATQQDAIELPKGDHRQVFATDPGSSLTQGWSAVGGLPPGRP